MKSYRMHQNRLKGQPTLCMLALCLVIPAQVLMAVAITGSTANTLRFIYSNKAQGISLQTPQSSTLLSGKCRLRRSRFLALRSNSDHH